MQKEIEEEYHSYSRKKYGLIILPRFQLKIISLAFFASIGTVIIAGGAFYYLVERQFSRVMELVQLDAAAKTELLSSMSVSVLYLMVLCGAFSILMLGFSIAYSHRIAGPIYQINKVLDQFMEGQLEARVFLRRGDEFFFLGDKINHILGLASRETTTKKKQA